MPSRGVRNRSPPWLLVGEADAGVLRSPLRRPNEKSRAGRQDRTAEQVLFTILLAEGHHAVQGDFCPLLFVVRDDDVVHDMAVNEVLERPAKMGGIDAVHGGALTYGGRQKKYLLVGLLLLQSIDQIQF